MFSAAVPSEDYARGARASLHYCTECRPGREHTERLLEQIGEA